MLRQEPQEETNAQPAAQKRVTAEELAAAINALEADRQREASRLAGTVEIGAVVEEMGLDATPEEVWAQVQRQREAAAEKAAIPPLQSLPQAARTAAAQAVAAATTPAAARRRVRGWHEIKGWAWILFWCCGGLGLVTGVLHPSHGIDVSGNHAVSTYTVHHEDATVDGDYNTITLRGDVKGLTVDGHDNTITVLGSVEAVTVDDDGNTIHWSKDPTGRTTHLEDSGNGNHVGLNAPSP